MINLRAYGWFTASSCKSRCLSSSFSTRKCSKILSFMASRLALLGRPRSMGFACDKWQKSQFSLAQAPNAPQYMQGLHVPEACDPSAHISIFGQAVRLADFEPLATLVRFRRRLPRSVFMLELAISVSRSFEPNFSQTHKSCQVFCHSKVRFIAKSTRSFQAPQLHLCGLSPDLLRTTQEQA